ncbi:carbon starvation CstA family protein [Escherichia coli]
MERSSVGGRHFDYAPDVTTPALTEFVDGTGPVWTCNLFPFLFITIAVARCLASMR